MKKADVIVGKRYVMKVSNKLATVLITNVCQYGGWYGLNTKTNRDVRIRSAAKLRYTEEQYRALLEKVRLRRLQVPPEPPTDRKAS